MIQVDERTPAPGPTRDGAQVTSTGQGGDLAQWLLDERGFRPVTFGTLTFDRTRRAVTEAGALRQGRWLLRALNQQYGGPRYRNKWGHSFCSYILAVEPHQSGDPHLHLLTDTSIPFTWLHDIWNRTNGYAWLREVTNCEAAMRYVCKYIAKSGEVPSIWIQPRPRTLDLARSEVTLR